MVLFRRTTSSRGSIKPFSALATLGVSAHNGFERRAGVGIVGEPWIGRRTSNILWTTLPSVLLAQAFGRKPRDEGPLAFAAGMAVAGSAVHFVEWPWRRRFGVLPWLTAAEGLEPDMLDAYNTILWLWMAAGLGSIAFETERKDRRWAAAGLGTAPLLLLSARHHFRWAREQAEHGDPHFSRALLADSPRRTVSSAVRG